MHNRPGKLYGAEELVFWLFTSITRLHVFPIWRKNIRNTLLALLYGTCKYSGKCVQFYRVNTSITDSLGGYASHMLLLSYPTLLSTKCHICVSKHWYVLLWHKMASGISIHIYLSRQIKLVSPYSSY